MKVYKIFLLLTLPLLIFNACMLGPKYKKPVYDLPQNTAPDEDYYISFRPNWWKMFKDENLNKIIHEALIYNTDLIAATARLDYARANYISARAGRMPALTASVNPAKADSNTPYITGTSEAALSASFELDLFGKYRALSKSAYANWLSSKAAREQVRLTLIGQVAKAYFKMLSLDLQLKIAQYTLKSREEDYKIYKIRFENGYINKVDLKRVEAEMYSVSTQVENTTLSLLQAQTNLQVLLGKSPKEIVEGPLIESKNIDDIFVVPTVPENIPSTLLKRRPDIIKAEQALIAANAQISAARAAYFPDISLTGMGGFASEPLHHLFETNSSFWQISGQGVLNIFQGGKIIAQNKMAGARYREMLASYQNTVQLAFKDALDSLNANRLYRKIYTETKQQTEALKETYQLTKMQQDAGLINTTDLLLVEQNLLSAEMRLVQARQAELEAVVSLAVAVGGGFEEDKFLHPKKHKNRD